VDPRRRVHPARGEPGRGPVRTGDPHVRDRDPLHPRRGRGADREAEAGPPGHRGPVARRGKARLGGEPHPRRSRRWSRRAARRDAPGTGSGPSDGPQAVELAEFPALMETRRGWGDGRTPPARARLAAAACSPARLRAAAPAPAGGPSPRPLALSPRP
jgi:hypothetical protein